MPIASGPATPPTTAPTSPTSPTNTTDFIDCEKGSIDEEDEEIIEECDEKNSQDGFPDIPSTHRPEDGRRKLVQRSKNLDQSRCDQSLNIT